MIASVREELDSGGATLGSQVVWVHESVLHNCSCPETPVWRAFENKEKPREPEQKSKRRRTTEQDREARDSDQMRKIR